MNNQKMDWEGLARDYVKGLVKARDVGYVQLSEKLKAMGINESQVNLSNKINRGTFSVVFLLKILEALELKMKFVNKEIREKETKTIDATAFLKAYKELNRICVEETSLEPSDLVFKKLSDAHDKLLSQAGISPELTSHICNESSDDWSIHKKDLSEEDIMDYWSYLMKEQRTLDLVDNLVLYSRDEESAKEKEIKKIVTPFTGSYYLHVDNEGFKGNYENRTLKNLIIKKDDIFITNNTSETIKFIEEVSMHCHKQYEEASSKNLRVIEIDEILGLSAACAMSSYWDQAILCHTIEEPEECQKVFTELIEE